MKTHKDLDVWKNAIILVTLIYKSTANFPSSEIYGLSNQIRRAAVSIPSNIAEGAARAYDKEFIQFLHISQGSLSEFETQLIIARNLEYLNSQQFEELNQKQIEIRAQLSGLIKYLKNKTK